MISKLCMLLTFTLCSLIPMLSPFFRAKIPRITFDLAEIQWSKYCAEGGRAWEGEPGRESLGARLHSVFPRTVPSSSVVEALYQ